MNISGSLHVTIQTGVLIETVAEHVAKVRWCSCNIFSIQDHAAAAIAKTGTSTVFACKGEIRAEYWWCTEQIFTWPGCNEPDQIINDGSDTTMFIPKDPIKWNGRAANCREVSEETTTGLHRLKDMTKKDEVLSLPSM